MVVAGIADASGIVPKHKVNKDGKYETGRFVTLKQMREQLNGQIEEAKALRDPVKRTFARDELVATADRLQNIANIECSYILPQLQQHGLGGIRSEAPAVIKPLVAEESRPVTEEYLPRGALPATNMAEGAALIRAAAGDSPIFQPTREGQPLNAGIADVSENNKTVIPRRGLIRSATFVDIVQKNLGWGLVVEAFHWHVIEQPLDFVNLGV